MTKNLLTATCIAGLAAAVANIAAPKPLYAEGVCDASSSVVCKTIVIPGVCVIIEGEEVCTQDDTFTMTGVERPDPE